MWNRGYRASYIWSLSPFWHRVLQTLWISPMKRAIEGVSCYVRESESEIPQSCPTLWDPVDCGYQATPSMGFCRQEYWRGLPFAFPGDLPDPGIKPRSPTFLADALPSDGIPVELFQILKDGAVKVLHSICQQIWKMKQWPQDWIRSVFIPIQKKGNVKECSNYRTIALILHASKVILKILQARLPQYTNHGLPDVQAGFRKGRGTRDQLPTFAGSLKKQESSRKISTFVLLTMPKPLTVWITTNCGKFLER